MTTPAPFPSLERQNPWITFLLALITLGFYVPIWFIIQRKALNEMSQYKKINIVEPITILGLYAFDTIAAVFIQFTDFFGVDSAAAMDTYLATSDLISWVGLIWVVVLCFRVKDMLKDFVGTRNYKLGFVGFYTFFLSIYYLQYKVNQIMEEEDHYVDIDNFGTDTTYREF